MCGFFFRKLPSVSKRRRGRERKNKRKQEKEKEKEKERKKERRRLFTKYDILSNMMKNEYFKYIRIPVVERF